MAQRRLRLGAPGHHGRIMGWITPSARPRIAIG
ncbi:hypothetical protein STVIR_3280 [Streptomyces viridochromogenes Tue57]|uniref:Uncharacterized protein n=1 Tax=Streptomyces viridochromogenes Tue57 TaxID=1160705 RepID=L8PK24_STRVR|nr:hypothetical protein STVIR_3280 [Streptomyces viridochromogenes Tue57]